MEHDNNNMVRGLHEAIIYSAIRYLADNGVEDIDTLEFNCDNLGESIKVGYWHPSTDSSCTILHYDKLMERSI